MNICYGDTFWGRLLYLCEIACLILMSYFSTKYLKKIYFDDDHMKRERFDLLVICLSITQVYIMLFSLLFGDFYFFSLISEVIKFSENSLIAGCLLYMIMMWQHYSITNILAQHYMVILLVFDVIILIYGFLFEYSPLETNFCKTLTILILAVIGLVSNLVAVGFAIFKFLDEKEDLSLNLIIEREEDQYHLNHMFTKYVTSIKKMKKYYLIIVILFAVSYCIEVYFKIFMTTKVERVIEHQLPSDDGVKISISTVETECLFYGHFGNSFSFKEFLICGLSFVSKDIGPHVYIFLTLFIFKPSNLSRSNSFIELEDN